MTKSLSQGPWHTPEPKQFWPGDDSSNAREVVLTPEEWEQMRRGVASAAS